jgi:hypothetical protein
MIPDFFRGYPKAAWSHKIDARPQDTVMLADSIEARQARREYDVHCLAEAILETPARWGVNDPDQCVAMAEHLVNMKWLVSTGRVRP